jgi:hypothetical protein
MVYGSLQRFSHVYGKLVEKKAVAILVRTSRATVMPRHHISQDLKARIPILFYEQDFTMKEICKILEIRKSLVYSSLAYFRAYGVAHNPHVHCKTGRR